MMSEFNECYQEVLQSWGNAPKDVLHLLHDAHHADITAERETNEINRRAIEHWKQRAESAEQRNREAMEQEPYALEIKHPDGCTELVYPAAVFKYRAFPDEWISQNLYAAPIPPADIAELQKSLKWLEQHVSASQQGYEQRIAELTRKLAEQQAEAEETRRLCRLGIDHPDKYSWSSILTKIFGLRSGAEELTKLLEEARKQEREECAQICESLDMGTTASLKVHVCASAIRAKGN